MSDYSGPRHMRVIEPEEKPEPKGGIVLETILMLACAIVLAVLLRTFVFESYKVPSGSMLDTIQIGDRLIGEKVSYRFSEPKRGDIVTFLSDNAQGGTDILVKRVIATAGQTVDLDSEGRVVVDGEVLDEPYTQGKPSRPLDSDIVYPYQVPDGSIWVMGDNRTNSSDSRMFGAVPLDRVTSHVVFTFWPPSSFGAM